MRGNLLNSAGRPLLGNSDGDGDGDGDGARWLLVRVVVMAFALFFNINTGRWLQECNVNTSRPAAVCRISHLGGALRVAAGGLVGVRESSWNFLCAFVGGNISLWYLAALRRGAVD